MLTRDQILNTQDIKVNEVPIPEWNGTVKIRSMTGRQRDEYERALSDASKVGELHKNMRARLVAATVIDDNDNLLFTESDVEALGEKNWKALDRIANAASKLNAITDSAVEEVAKNSEPSPDAASI